MALGREKKAPPMVKQVVEGHRQRFVADVEREYVHDVVHGFLANAEEDPVQARECSDKQAAS